MQGLRITPKDAKGVTVGKTISVGNNTVLEVIATGSLKVDTEQDAKGTRLYISDSQKARSGIIGASSLDIRESVISVIVDPSTISQVVEQIMLSDRMEELKNTINKEQNVLIDQLRSKIEELESQSGLHIDSLRDELTSSLMSKEDISSTLNDQTKINVGLQDKLSDLSSRVDNLLTTAQTGLQNSSELTTTIEDVSSKLSILRQDLDSLVTLVNNVEVETSRCVTDINSRLQDIDTTFVSVDTRIKANSSSINFVRKLIDDAVAIMNKESVSRSEYSSLNDELSQRLRDTQDTINRLYQQIGSITNELDSTSDAIERSKSDVINSLLEDGEVRNSILTSLYDEVGNSMEKVEDNVKNSVLEDTQFIEMVADSIIEADVLPTLDSVTDSLFNDQRLLDMISFRVPSATDVAKKVVLTPEFSEQVGGSLDILLGGEKYQKIISDYCPTPGEVAAVSVTPVADELASDESFIEYIINLLKEYLPEVASLVSSVASSDELKELLGSVVPQVGDFISQARDIGAFVDKEGLEETIRNISREHLVEKLTDQNTQLKPSKFIMRASTVNSRNSTFDSNGGYMEINFDKSSYAPGNSCVVQGGDIICKKEGIYIINVTGSLCTDHGISTKISIADKEFKIPNNRSVNPFQFNLSIPVEIENKGKIPVYIYGDKAGDIVLQPNFEISMCNMTECSKEEGVSFFDDFLSTPTSDNIGVWSIEKTGSNPRVSSVTLESIIRDHPGVLELVAGGVGESSSSINLCKNGYCVNLKNMNMRLECMVMVTNHTENSLHTVGLVHNRSDGNFGAYFEFFKGIIYACTSPSDKLAVGTLETNMWLKLCISCENGSCRYEVNGELVNLFQLSDLSSVRPQFMVYKSMEDKEFSNMLVDYCNINYNPLR